MEEFDTREKRRATGAVFMTGRFSHRGSSWTRRKTPRQVEGSLVLTTGAVMPGVGPEDTAKACTAKREGCCPFGTCF